MSKEIIKLAQQLGSALRESEEFSRYQAAKEKCRDDKALQAKIDDFKLQKQIYDTESAKENADEGLLGAIKQCLDTLYDEAYANENMKEFTAAEDALNVLLSAINMTITSYISEQPASVEGGCTHDCSSCHACSH